MRTRVMGRAITVAMLLGAYALGYVSGTVTQQPAGAQGLGGVLQQAGKAGGALGAAGELGTSIVEMQEHVSGMQKNLDTLRKVQSTLTGK